MQVLVFMLGLLKSIAALILLVLSVFHHLFERDHVAKNLLFERKC